MAETAAVGRALSDAGYGVQFADVGEENDPAQVDAGIPYQNPQMPDSGAMENAAMPDSGVMPNAPMPTYGEMPGQPEYAGQQMMNHRRREAPFTMAVDKCLATVPLRLPLRRQRPDRCCREHYRIWIRPFR